MSNDRCTYDPKTKTEDDNKKEEAEDITDTPTADNTNNNPTTVQGARKEDEKSSDIDDDDVIPTYRVLTRTAGKQSNDRTENILCKEPDTDPIDFRYDLARSPIVRILSNTRHANVNLTYQFEHANTTYSKDVTGENVPQELVEMYNEQTHALTKQPNTMRKRGRPC